MGGKKTKRYAAALLTTVLLAVLVITAGCSQKEEKKPIEITLMHGWGGTLKTHYTMQQIYLDFSKENPDITLNCVPYSDSSIAVDKANDMLAVGKVPDIVSTNGLSYYVNNAVKLDMAMDLMPYMQKDGGLKAAVHPSVFELWTTGDGKLYTVPDALEVAGYWYNEEHLKQAGITDESGAVSVPRTWPEFMDMIRRIKAWSDENGGSVSVCSMDQVQLSESLFLARLAGENDNGMEAAGNTQTELEKETVQNTMRDIAGICGSSDNVENIETARQNFIDGKSTLYFNGVWESNALAESREAGRIRYAAYPGADGRTLSYISPSSGYVFARQEDEKKEKACIRFLKYILSEDVQMKLAVQTGQAPSNPGIDLKEVEKGNPALGNAVSTAYAADAQIKTIWSVWPEEKLEVVKRYGDLARQGWKDSDGIDMTNELNRLAR